MRIGPSALMITLPGWTSPWHTTTSSDPTKSSQPRWRSTAARRPACGRRVEVVADVGEERLVVPPREVGRRRLRQELRKRRGRHVVHATDRCADRSPVDRCRDGFDERPRRDREPVRRRSPRRGSCEGLRSPGPRAWRRGRSTPAPERSGVATRRTTSPQRKMAFIPCRIITGAGNPHCSAANSAALVAPARSLTRRST